MGIVRPVLEKFSYAWTFFIPFILVTTFTTLNLLIAVLVSAMQSETEAAAEKRAEEGHLEREQLLQEVQALRKTIEGLKDKLK